MRRRDLLAGVAALGVLTPLSACASTGAALGETSADRRLAAMLERHAEALSEQDGGSERLGDYSLAGRDRARQANAARLAELRTVDRAGLSPRAAVDYDTALFVYQAMADQYGRYGFSDINLRPSPYVVSQMNGAYYWLPEGISSR